MNRPSIEAPIRTTNWNQFSNVYLNDTSNDHAQSERIDAWKKSERYNPAESKRNLWFLSSRQHGIRHLTFYLNSYIFTHHRTFLDPSNVTIELISTSCSEWHNKLLPAHFRPSKFMHNIKPCIIKFCIRFEVK